MFPFRPSRAATALLELAEAMLAPEALELRPKHALAAAPEPATDADRVPRLQAHPHRRAATIERRRRPAPPQSEPACLAPLTRAGRAASRRLDAPSPF